MQRERLLIVDDDPLIRGSLYELLQGKGYDVEMASDGLEALEHLSRKPFHAVLADLRMPRVDGLRLLETVKSKYPLVAVVIITGFGTIDAAVESMRHGAVDFLTKPVQPQELEETLRRLLEPIRPVGEGPPSDPFRELIGQHPSVKQLCETLRMVAASPATILLEGESGTGKRVVAHAIHQADPKRREHAFIEVSCGALPETLLESELFGHVRGAFTGAVRDKQGRFELANGGTILLDEIDTFSPHLQVKLLRVLQERTFERVGDGRSLKVDVRVIAATNRHLNELVRQGTFREDLYYRLNVIALRLPPLRERASDIPLLADHFLRQACTESGKAITGISEETMRLLMAYPWPGNVRELENTIERAVILAQRRLIMPQDLPESHQALARRDGAPSNPHASAGSLKEAIRVPERDIILQALHQAQGNRSLAAKRLRIHRATLYRKLRQLALETESVRSS